MGTRGHKLPKFSVTCDGCGTPRTIAAASAWHAAGRLTRAGWVVFGTRRALCPKCKGGARRRKKPSA